MGAACRRELLLGPKRFTDLRAGLPNTSPNVLAQRLRELEGGDSAPEEAASACCIEGVRAHRVGHGARAGDHLAGALGRPLALKPRDAALGVDSLILSMRTMFDADAAEGSRPPTS